MQVSKLPINSAEMSQVHPLLLSVAQNCRKCVQNKQIKKKTRTNESQPFVMSYYGGALMQKAVFKRPSTVPLVGLIMQGCSTWVRDGKYRPGNGLIWDLGQAARPGSTGSTGDIIHQPVKRIRIEREVNGSERRRSITVGLSCFSSALWSCVKRTSPSSSLQLVLGLLAKSSPFPHPSPTQPPTPTHPNPTPCRNPRVAVQSVGCGCCCMLFSSLMRAVNVILFSGVCSQHLRISSYTCSTGHHTRSRRQRVERREK